MANRVVVGGRAAVGACALVAVFLFAAPLHADNAPLQESPIGLTPGVAGTTVRMVTEKVDIDVIERDGVVHAVVSASFDMFNRGPTANLTVGFPRFNYYFVAGGGYLADFDPARIADFRASSDATSFQPTVRPVKFTSPNDAQYAGDWYVWQMSYPGGKSTNVRVSYDQMLYTTQHGFVQVGYILRTGALWDGTIGDATITMTSSTGGSFISPNNATSATSNQVTWQLRDVKPTFDLVSLYVPGDKRQRLTSAEARIAAANPSAEDFATAVGAFVDIVARDEHGLPSFYWTSPVPKVFADRYDQVRGWAVQGVTLNPNSASSFEALGDIEYLLAFPAGVAPMGRTCRPMQAVSALQKAVDLGSPTAQAKLDGLNSEPLAPEIQVAPNCSPIAAPSAEPAPGLTLDVLKGAEYRSAANGLGGGRTVQLVDGAYAAPVGSDSLGVSLWELSAFGDLDNDGVGDAVAILLESTGGNNVRIVLEAFLNKDGQPSPVGSIAVGDRTTAPKSLTIQSGSITLKGLSIGPGDPLCCPTQPFTHVFSVQDDQLVVDTPAEGP